MANFLGTREPRRAVKCARCGNLLHFRHWLDHDRITLAGGYFCGQWKLCLTCAIKRGATGLANLVPLLVDQLQAAPQLRAYLVTVTTKDGADCAERFEHLRTCGRRYLERRNDAKKKRRGYVEANKASGIYWAFEGGLGKGSGSWHWHSHAVWLCKVKPDARKLSEEWHAITGDSFIVDVREFRCTKRGGERTSEAICADVLEVCKYTLKPHAMTPALAYETHTATAHKHFTGRVGSLRVPVAEREAIMAKHRPEMDGRYRDIFYRYCERAGAYQETDYALPSSTTGKPMDTDIRRLEGRAINRTLGIRDRAAVVAAMRDRRQPELDTRMILGDTDGHPQTENRSRSLRFESPPHPDEDFFATEAL